MATVYLAIQESFQREVALKVMSPSLSEDGNFSGRFLREARIVARLVHPHIVTVHDVGIENGHHYLSMEYVEGFDLKQRLPSLTGEQQLRVLREVAMALDYAGKKGYVHRDVKPENIMLNDMDGRAVLMDFGIARATDAVSDMTRTGTALGTPHYMSPEQARGEIVDCRSDLYSLGVLFFYMLTGKVPFEADSAVAVGIKHISAKVPRLPQLLQSYQPVVDRLMAKKPEDRYQTGSQLVADLSNLDASALSDWRPQQEGFEYLPSHEHTPVRSDAVSAVRDSGAISAERAASSAMSQETALLSSTPQPREPIRIPKEDLADRAIKEGSSLKMVVLGVAVASALGLGVYVNRQFAPTVPDASAPMPVAQLEVDSSPPVQADPVPEEIIGPIDPLVVDAVLTEADVSVDQAVIDGAASPLEQLIEQSRRLAEVAQNEPEVYPELIALYREILQLSPEHEATLSALEELKTSATAAVAIQLDQGENDAAQQGLIIALADFPELESDEIYLQLEQRLREAQQLDELLVQADAYLERNRLLRPPGENALEAYQSVLALAPENERAKQGLLNIVQRYRALAVAAQQRKNYQKALSLVGSGLSIDSKNSELLAMQQQLSVDSDRQRKINALLLEATTLEKQQQLFGAPDSATERYQTILEIDPQQMDATLGLTRILDNLVSETRELLEASDYLSAMSNVQRALESLPDNARLLALRAELEANRPLIDKLLLSGSPIEDFDTPALEKISLDRTLHIAFRYSGLEQATTVLQVLLFDGARSVQIAAVPVVLVGDNGDTQFRIERVVDGFPHGGYHLDILLAGERVFTESFVIGN